MISNYKKYIIYKNKYNKLKQLNKELSNDIIQTGGYKDLNQEKFNKILNFIKKSEKIDIQKNLYNIMKDTTYCLGELENNDIDTVLGEGVLGKVYISKNNKTFPFKLGGHNIDLPVVVKKSKTIDHPSLSFDLNIINDKLYIAGSFNMITEALILIYIRKLWHKTVHLPLMFAYGTCSNKKIVNKIITLKYGLPNSVEINLDGKIYNEKSLYTHKKQIDIIKNNISTLKELYEYINYNKNENNEIMLPNGELCSIAKLFDYICISYLVTHHLLTENNIFPHDMYPKNIFIHWLNDKSYYNDKNLKSIKYIIYKIGKKYYKIKTFGFVIILGDVGSFTMQVKKDIIIVGQITNIKANYKLVSMKLKPEFTNIDFISLSKDYLPLSIFNDTIAFKILNSEPYYSHTNHYMRFLGFELSYIDKFKSTIELLNFFDEKYGINEYIENNNNILIKIKNYDIM
jgi:hypothetical protein